MQRTVSFALSLGILLSAAWGQHPSGPVIPPHQRLESSVDSGFLDNRASQPRVVFKTRIRHAKTAWLQLRFDELTHLAPGSSLRITSVEDKGVQRHDALTLGQWSMYSALFNGGEVELELVAAPSSRNRVKVAEEVRGAIQPVGPAEAICGPTDDRVKSTDARQGRLWVGCTGWLAGRSVSGSLDLMLTAGHCATSGTRILELNVPDSTASGQVRRAAPNDQYPYNEIQRLDGGVGADWMVCTVGPNSNTGRRPTEVNGGRWYQLGAVPGSTGGQNITITGYGTTSPRNALSQVQKTHTGPLATITATSLCYATDTTGGNSGSPIIHANTGSAIGIHTHAGCGLSGGCNNGTRIDRSDLQAAIAAITKAPGQFSLFGAGCRGTGQAPSSCLANNGTGGTLSRTSAGNEYAYQVLNSTARSITGFSIFTASASSQVTVRTAIYTESNGAPATTPLVTGTMTVGPTPGFYRTNLTANVPAGNFYIAVDHSAFDPFLADLSSGTPGIAFWRNPPFSSATFNRSGLVSRSSFQVFCAGGGPNNAIPLIGNRGLPEINSSFEVTLAQGRASATAAMILGLSRTTWAGNALPLSLTPLGAPGCNLNVSFDLSVPTTLNGNGDAAVRIGLPNDTTLIGASAFLQWYVVDQGANALQVAVSAGAEAKVGG